MKHPDRPALESLLARAEVALDDTLLAPVRTSLASVALHFREKRFHLAVLGQFKRGKSTFINALLGNALLPTGVLPVTAVPVFNRSTDPTGATVYFTDGSERGVDVGSISTYITEKENPENRRGVRQVDIGTSCPLLNDGVVLIDTPGIGSAHEHNTTVTMQLLPRCDAAVIVLSPDPPITDTELRFLVDATSHVPRMFYVLNKIDTHSADEIHEVMGYLTDTLRARAGLQDEPVWPVSARRALREPEPGIDLVRQALRQFFQEDKGAALCDVTARRLERHLSEALQLIEIQTQSLQMPLEALRQRAERFETLRQSLADEAAALAASLTGLLNGLLEPLRALTRSMAADCRNEVARTLRETADACPNLPPSRLRDRLEDTMETTLTAFFDERAQSFCAEALRRTERVLGPTMSRACSLVEDATRQAADLFGVEPLPTELPHLQLTWQTATWKTWVGHGRGDVEHVLSAGLLKLRSRDAQIKRALEDLQGDTETLSTRNANVIYNEVSERIRKSLRENVATLEMALARATESVGDAIATARELRAQGSETAGQRLLTLQSLARQLQALKQELMDSAQTGK